MPCVLRIMTSISIISHTGPGKRGNKPNEWDDPSGDCGRSEAPNHAKTKKKKKKPHNTKWGGGGRREIGDESAICPGHLTKCALVSRQSENEVQKESLKEVRLRPQASALDLVSCTGTEKANLGKMPLGDEEAWGKKANGKQKGG